MARRFLAIETPQALAAALLRTLPDHPGVRPVPAGQLHLTLRFLGEQDRATAAAVDVALQTLSGPALTLAVRGVGRFRSGQGTILWAGLAPDPALDAWFDEIGRTLGAVSVPAGRRRARPHLTLARCRPDVPERVLLEWLARHQDLSAPPWVVARLVLFESFLDRQGARHVARATVPVPSAGLGPDTS